MKVAIPTYEELFSAVSSNRFDGSMQPERQKRIHKMLDTILPKIREGIMPDVTLVSAPFNHGMDADIADDVTAILQAHGYRFSIYYIPSQGYEWKVEIYAPGQ